MSVTTFACRGMKAQKAVDEVIRKAVEVRRDRDGLTKCRVCSCTETRPCFPPCGWERGEEDLCDSCAETVRVLGAWLDGAHRPSVVALMRERKRQRDNPIGKRKAAGL